jgi:hypothetical protein
MLGDFTPFTAGTVDLRWLEDRGSARQSAVPSVPRRGRSPAAGQSRWALIVEAPGLRIGTSSADYGVPDDARRSPTPGRTPTKIGAIAI